MTLSVVMYARRQDTIDEVGECTERSQHTTGWIQSIALLFDFTSLPLRQTYLHFKHEIQFF